VAVQTHVPDRVRELRAAGYSPKQIAKTLDLRPAVAARLVRILAAEDAAAAPEPAVVGCWVSPGWSAHLTVDGPEEWADVPIPEEGMTGLAAVVVARRHRPQRVSVCGYLVDTFCLGVKNTLGPELMNERDLPDFLHMFFTSFEAVGQPLAAPLELGRHLVWGGSRPRPPPGFRTSPRLPGHRRPPRGMDGHQQDHVRSRRCAVLRVRPLRQPAVCRPHPGQDLRRGQLPLRRRPGLGTPDQRRRRALTAAALQAPTC